ncbi:MAG: hypothetical protein RL758_918 [Pseudomonadota bacterium]|jgi:Protein of unknown function (DUF3047)
MNTAPSHLSRRLHGVFSAVFRSFAVIALLGGGLSQAQTPLVHKLSDFAKGLDGWKEVVLKADLPRNQYQARVWDGAAAVEVVSKASMSLLGRPLEVDLKATPVLCWRWRVDAPLVKADMNTKAGDDYAARLYVSLGLPDSEKGFGLRTQLGIARAIWGPDVPDAALNYVWDNRHPIGTEKPNAYTHRTTMVVLRTGAQHAGRWVWERRDIAADAARLYSPNARPVQLAVTADTDNTGESARAGFADIHFVEKNTPCQGAS